MYLNFHKFTNHKQVLKTSSMKLHFTLLFLFITICSQANYQSATIYYTNGQSEKGLIDSFLENKFFDFNFFGTFEQGLIYNDKSINFKLNPEAEASKVPIENIDKIILHYIDFDKEYKALFIRNINRMGMLEESKVRMFLPLLRSGKINLYGFYHREVSSNPGNRNPSKTITVTELFYYQNAKENYAIDYFNFEVQDMFTMRQRLVNPLKNLFKDCPELVAGLDDRGFEESLSREEKKKLKKEAKESSRAMMRQYYSIPADKRRGDLLLYYQNVFKQFDTIIQKYEDCK